MICMSTMTKSCVREYVYTQKQFFLLYNSLGISTTYKYIEVEVNLFKKYFYKTYLHLMLLKTIILT